jgi:hypothetical protein
VPFINNVLAFIELLSLDDTKEDSVLRGAVGVVGDLAVTMTVHVRSASVLVTFLFCVALYVVRVLL